MDDNRLPALPGELDCEIFETAAFIRPASISTLILVAWPETWLEPLLYRTILLTDFPLEDLDGHPPVIHPVETIIHMLHSKPPDLLASSVRHVFMTGFPAEVATSILSACAGVEDIQTFDNETLAALLPLIARLPLRRLFCYLGVPFGGILFDLVSHGTKAETQLWMKLALLPKLTHIAFNDPGPVSIWLALLRTCRSLHVLVVLTAVPVIENYLKKEEELVWDARFVGMNCAMYLRD
ncbi:hypothetical protein C8R43DRAFT_1132557 [Mycena crocata]|nr:hypothetical protein C8R43DRAFT_1132557 [Mycena crocata]